MNISSVSNSNEISYPQNSQAQKDKFMAAAKKAGVSIKPGEKPSDIDLEKIKKAGACQQ